MIVVTYRRPLADKSRVIANMKATREEFDRQFETWEKVRGSDVPLVFHDFRPPGFPERMRTYVIGAHLIRSIEWAENVAEPLPLVDRQNAALAAARVGGNLAETDAILATMTLDELCDLVAAAVRLKGRAMNLIVKHRKEERGT